MKLTDTAIRNAEPKKKQYKLYDGNGLFLLVRAAGKYWRMDYTFQKKRKTLAFGVYPKLKLKDARKKCIDAKDLLEQGIDPGQLKKDSKRQQDSEDTFKSVAMEWYKKNLHTWVPDHGKNIFNRLDKNIFPWLGDKPIASISSLDLLTVLRRIESRGAIESAHRIKQTCGQIFRYAIAIGKAEHDISAALKGAIPPPNRKHMSTIVDPKEIGGLLRALDDYKGYFITRCALKLAPLTFIRPGELRHAEWSEVNLKKREWRIPAEKMKMTRPHIIPLAQQAVEVFIEIQPYTQHRSKYVFPSIRSDKRPMSENTVLAALRRMGYQKDEMTGHGFRAMASTLLHENDWPSHIIELQLAHVEKNSVKAAYNHALYMKDRIKMMQWWADYLDKLKNQKA